MNQKMVLESSTFTRGEFAGHTPCVQLRQAVQQQQVLASRKKSQVDFSGRVTMRLNVHKVSIQRRMRQLPRGE
jgi:hypothetical protein